MSRTNKDRGHRRKGELWSRRPCAFLTNEKYYRKICAKAERQADKKLIKSELEVSDG